MTLSAQIELPERFRFDQEIGRGGMAVVDRAYDRHLDRFVAIKVLSPDLSHAVGAERFQREIALMASTTVVSSSVRGHLSGSRSNGCVMNEAPTTLTSDGGFYL